MPVEGRLYPANLVMTGRPALVVGGGAVAARKAAELVECGAVVTLVAPDICDVARGLPGVSLVQRPYEPSDVVGHRLVVAATDDPAVNARIHSDAEAAGIWVNAVDDGEHCTFTTPGRVRRGDLMITVSTGGHSPALTTWLRRRLESELGPEYELLLGILADERASIRSSGRSTVDLDWQAALDSGMLELIREGRLAEAKERLQACLSSSSD